MRSTEIVRFLLFFFILTFSACQSKLSTENEILPPTSPTLITTADSILFAFTPLPPAVQSPTPVSQSTPDAMHFSLPTPGVQPNIAWRPPLYPVPWVLSPFDHFYFKRPISVNQKNWPNPDYRYGGIFFKADAVHTGIDIPAEAGTPVLAAGSGEVVWADWGLYTGELTNQNDPYGLAVVIRHDFGFNDQPIFTVYAHLEQVDVIPGQWLQTGDSIGAVGQTGFTTGPHLHFEVRLGADTYFNTRNPELWLVPPQGWGVLALRITDSYNNPIPDLEVTLISDETKMEWTINTYPILGVLGDEYYQENLVISDLPEGAYTISFKYRQINHEIIVQIFPGEVTYYAFRGVYGFGTTPPPTDITNFIFTPNP